MKYIDADKLKKSISNYIEGARAALNPIDGDADYYKGKIDACEDMQEFITSLQQEQPKFNISSAGSGAMGETPPRFKLEVKEQPEEGLEVTDFCKPIDPGIAQCVADHWWEMIGEESTNKKSVEGLEEEITRYLREECSSDNEPSVSEIARHFAEWGAEHLKR